MHLLTHMPTCMYKLRTFYNQLTLYSKLCVHALRCAYMYVCGMYVCLHTYAICVCEDVYGCVVCVCGCVVCVCDNCGFIWFVLL